MGELRGGVEFEVLGAMPDRFVFLYELLWIRAVGTGVGRGRSSAENVELAPARRLTRLSTSQTEVRGGAHGSHRSGGSAHLIDSEAALNKKRRVDKKLRAIAREMAVWLGDGEARSGQRRCSVCKQFGDADWLYCPRDGKPMEETT